MSRLSFKIVRKINSDGELGENSLAVFLDGKEINERNLGYILEMYFENVPNVTKNVFDGVLFNLEIANGDKKEFHVDNIKIYSSMKREKLMDALNYLKSKIEEVESYIKSLSIEDNISFEI